MIATGKAPGITSRYIKIHTTSIYEREREKSLYIISLLQGSRSILSIHLKPHTYIIWPVLFTILLVQGSKFSLHFARYKYATILFTVLSFLVPLAWLSKPDNQSTPSTTLCSYKATESPSSYQIIFNL